MARQQKDVTYDNLTLMKDAGAITSSAAAQVSSANKILDLGSNDRVDARMIVDISAVDASSGDEQYFILVQGSTSASFASGVWNLGAAVLGDSSKSLETVDTTTGRREIAFCNEVNGTLFQYLRVYTFCAGTTPSINYTAFVGLKA